MRTFTKAHFSHQCIFSRVYFLSPLPSCLLCLRITSMSADPQNTSDGREDLNGRHMVQLQNAQKGFIYHKKSVFFWKMLSGAHFAPHSPFPNYNLNIENTQKWRLPLELKLVFVDNCLFLAKPWWKGRGLLQHPFNSLNLKFQSNWKRTLGAAQCASVYIPHQIINNFASIRESTGAE